MIADPLRLCTLLVSLSNLADLRFDLAYITPRLQLAARIQNFAKAFDQQLGKHPVTGHIVFDLKNEQQLVAGFKKMRLQGA
ncbi:hypothetical protein D3C75_1048590 [compost metagenome]